MGEGGGGRGEKLSPFFAFIFPLFLQKRLILTLNFPIRRLCISQFHLRPAPTPGLMRGICLPCQSRGFDLQLLHCPGAGHLPTIGPFPSF